MLVPVMLSLVKKCSTYDAVTLCFWIKICSRLEILMEEERERREKEKMKEEIKVS